MNNGYNFNPAFMRNYNSYFYPTYPHMPNNFRTPRIRSLFNSNSINSPQNKITFSGILNGASKTLGVINQAIPVIYQVKPIINNARTMLKVVRGLNSKDAPINDSPSVPGHSNDTLKKEQVNAPTFFA